MRLKLIILFSILFYFSNAQDNKIDYIKLKYSPSIAVCSGIEINILNNYSNTPIDVIIKYCEPSRKRKKLKFIQKTKNIKISQLEFKKIIDQFYKINNSDILNYVPSCLDGNDIRLEIGQFLSNNISYGLICLRKSQINTSLKELITTIQLILEITQIKIDDFN